MKIVIHYAEIALKGKNRPFFEKKLINNIERALDTIQIDSIKKEDTRIVLSLREVDIPKAEEKLKKVLGISHFMITHQVEPDVDAIIQKVEELIKNKKEIAFVTKRSNKQFPLTSPELNKCIGERAHELGIKINYKSEDKIYIEVTAKNVYIYTQKISGLKGMPVASSGKVLCLLSGGIDSSVAAYLMMKRGCSVDFLHVHPFKDNKEVVASKIITLIEVLNRYQYSAKLYITPYHAYQLATLNKIPESLDVVVFKKAMIHLAQELAKKYHYKALILGDSVAQVASQTLDNIKSIYSNTQIPILSPLIAFDKQEIIDLAQVIGTYQISIQPYKDCCSILARKPLTSSKTESVEMYLKELEEKGLIQELVRTIEIVKIH